MRLLLLISVFALAVPVAAGAQSLERGKYIVERVGMCHDCHTPRDATGQLNMSQALQGAPIGMKPIDPMPWADVAPPIAGVPGHFTSKQMAAFLQTGKRPDGSEPRPPMPPYRLSSDDAAAVTAYLRSLKK